MKVLPIFTYNENLHFNDLNVNLTFLNTKFIIESL